MSRPGWPLQPSRRSWLNVAAFILALTANWFGDSLDGTLARVRCQPRPRYGYYVDHVIDLFGTARLLTAAWPLRA